MVIKVKLWFWLLLGLMALPGWSSTPRSYEIPQEVCVGWHSPDGRVLHYCGSPKQVRKFLAELIRERAKRNRI